MENLFFIKSEIFILFITFVYIIYFMACKIYKGYFRVKKAIKKEEISKVKSALNKVDLNTKEKNYKRSKITKQLTDDEINSLSDMLKRAKINSSKGHFNTAKGLIIEGLAIDKFNKDLNLELASIYEKEKNYQNAEYIYKDLLDIIKDDTVVMKKLGYIYAMQGKMEKSLDIYLKVHRKKSSDEDVINMLSELTYDLKDYKMSIKYINQYLKFKPRDLNKMNMKALSLEKIRDFKDSVLVHKKILELQPYNTFSRDKVRELEKYA